MQQLASCPRLVSGARARPSARRTRAPALSRAEGAASLQELEAALSAAVAAEEWSEAARLRDELKLVRTNATAACLAASAAFYSAFERGSAAAMAAAWGTGEGVSCTHPGSACIHGRSSVLASWNEVFSSGSKFKVRLQDVVVHASETMGYVTCVEVVETSEGMGRLAAINVFECQAGGWVIVHHMATPLPLK